MKNLLILSKTRIVALTIMMLGFTYASNAQTPVGTFEIKDWFEEVFNSVNQQNGAEANIHVYGADRNKQQARLVLIRDGFTPPPNGLVKNVLFIYLTKDQYTRAIDILQSGRRAELRWDGNPTSGYLRQYK
ncbi:MAG: hypothetical protein MI810_08295 [Flavobacteriales bacterium]|jgi:hypothetical protein|nr:hypothetical protein [Flavobacteriales bacterium]